jgi:hypothetical protein
MPSDDLSMTMQSFGQHTALFGPAFPHSRHTMFAGKSLQFSQSKSTSLRAGAIASARRLEAGTSACRRVTPAVESAAWAVKPGRVGEARVVTSLVDSAAEGVQNLGPRDGAAARARPAAAQDVRTVLVLAADVAAVDLVA